MANTTTYSDFLNTMSDGAPATKILANCAQNLIRSESKTIAIALVVLTVSIIITRCCIPTFDGVRAPFIGYHSWLEPGIFPRMRFAKGAQGVIDAGYANFKRSMYKVSRNDRDILIISNNYVDELRNLPEEKLNSMVTLVRNFGGRYAHIDPLLQSPIASHALQTRITPQLGILTAEMEDELDYSFQKDMPPCKDWTPVNVHPLFLQMVARLSNRVFVGFPICRNEAWLESAIGFSHNVTLTTLVLRALPPFLRPFVAAVYPPHRKITAHIRTGQSILAPEVRRRRNLEATDPSYVKPHDLLQGMMDLATPDAPDSEPDDLAHRQLIMSLAAVHSTAAQAAQTMFDLCAYPHYIDELREEVVQVLREDGGRWTKHSHNKMRKMDSFLKETQRLNPPSLLGFHRSVEDPHGIRLHDNTFLPKGTHLCVASHALTRDPDLIKDPQHFNGMRYFNLRQSSPEEANKHQFAMTDRTHLHFGHGKQACPGRFLASKELKMMFAHFMLRYEFRYERGQGRAPCLNVDEFLFSDPGIKVLFRERAGVERVSVE